MYEEWKQFLYDIHLAAIVTGNLIVNGNKLSF